MNSIAIIAQNKEACQMNDYTITDYINDYYYNEYYRKQTINNYEYEEE